MNDFPITVGDTNLLAAIRAAENNDAKALWLIARDRLETTVALAAELKQTRDELAALQGRVSKAWVELGIRQRALAEVIGSMKP